MGVVVQTKGRFSVCLLKDIKFSSLKVKYPCKYLKRTKQNIKNIAHVPQNELTHFGKKGKFVGLIRVLF